jgi:hypothetical protein
MPQPGWRLELVALKTADDDVSVLAPDWIEQALQPIAFQTNDAMSCIYLDTILEYLLRGIAARAGFRTREKSAGQIARELAFAGWIDQALLERIDNALNWRNNLMHGLPVPRDAGGQTAEIEKLCRDLHAQAQNSED